MMSSSLSSSLGNSPWSFKKPIAAAIPGSLSLIGWVSGPARTTNLAFVASSSRILPPIACATACSQALELTVAVWATGTKATTASCPSPAEKTILPMSAHSRFIAARDCSKRAKSPCGSETAVQKQIMLHARAFTAISLPQRIPSLSTRACLDCSGGNPRPWLHSGAGAGACGSRSTRSVTAPKNSPALSRTRPVAQWSYCVASKLTITTGTPFRSAMRGSSFAGWTTRVLPMMKTRSAPSIAAHAASTARPGMGCPNMTVSGRRGLSQMRQVGALYF
mmetsp:Transcript_5823/g.13753  ORF Transcript_5823/g.13753 Transcript_5823/m.13753 type:complete len:278 (-) Transcript_5823:1056-1889(-)